MIELLLSRPLRVECHAALMTIGRADDRRRDLLAVLILAQQNRGRVTPELICRELLMDRPLIVGKKVIERCTNLSLLGRDGELTRVGDDALQTKEVFIPETGRYRVWSTPDPLVPDGFLGLEPAAEVPAADANQIAKSRHHSQLRGGPNVSGVLELPKRVLDLEDHIVTSNVGDPGRFRVMRVERMGEALPVNDHLSRSRLEWRVSPSRVGTVQSTGGIQGRYPQPPLEFAEVWEQALGEEFKNWDWADGGFLRTSFPDGLTQADMQNLTRSIELRPTLEGFDEFDETTVVGIPARPASEQDADAWAKWLQQQSLAEYQDHSGFQSLSEQISRRFLPGFRVELRSRYELALQFRKEASRNPQGRLPRAYWFVQAPLDLGDRENDLPQEE